MASSYPAALDTFSDPAATLAGPPSHGSLHKKLNDTVAAVQRTLGINPQGLFDSVSARLSDIVSIFPSLSGPGSATSGTVPAAGNGTYVACQLQIPAHTRAGTALVFAKCTVDTNIGGGTFLPVWQYYLFSNVGAVNFAKTRNAVPAADTAEMAFTATCFGALSVPANTSPVIGAYFHPLEATGTLSFSGDSAENSIHALFIPNP